MFKDRDSTFYKSFLPSLIAIVIGMIISIIVMFVANPENAFRAVIQLFKGPFNTPGMKGLGNLLYYMIPLMMTGLSVGFAFKTGLFNIGASGQFIVGAFVSILIGAKFTAVPESVRWIFALLGATLIGGIWGSIVGILKAYRNVNEVITSIMLNYIGMYLVNYLIPVLGIYNRLKNNTINISTHVPKFGLDKLFPGSFASGGIFIAVIIAIILYFVIDKTTFGYELKAVGLNRFASRYAGINENRSIVFSMMIAGALSGLAGGLVYLSGIGRHISIVEVLPQEGFDGIAVSLLGANHPLGIILSSLFMAYINMGGQSIQTLGYSPELIQMMTAIILYISALSLLFKQLLGRKSKSTPIGSTNDSLKEE